jgi:transposase
MHLNAAGIDVGAECHWVAVPPDRDVQPVQRFGTFTADLYALAEWLWQCQIETVVMESTGVYWIALFEVLEERGFDVKLVDAVWLK